MSDLIVQRPESINLVRIPDRTPPDFCEVCGIGHGLFWTGRYVSCIDCSKDLPKLRKMGVFLPQPDKTPQEFLAWLSQQKRLIRRLFT